MQLIEGHADVKKLALLSFAFNSVGSNIFRKKT